MSDETPRSEARAGLLVPYTNSNIEPDFAMMGPAGLALYATRIAGYGVEGVPGTAAMRAMGGAVPREALALLAPVQPDVILYGCTSATLTLGPAGDREFAARLAEAAGCPAITTSGAVIAALARLGAGRVALVTPYDASLGEATAEFLAAAGHEVVTAARPDAAPDAAGQGALSPEEIVELVARCDMRRADALVMACTDMRAVECIGTVEMMTGKPAVTSNQALMLARSARSSGPARRPGAGDAGGSAAPGVGAARDGVVAERDIAAGDDPGEHLHVQVAPGDDRGDRAARGG